MVNSLRDVLTSVFEVSNLLEQQRQGVITRQLAAWERAFTEIVC
jgi:magnesium transporter